MGISDYIKYTVKVFKYGDKFWFLKDKLHREDGPAIEYADGDKEWWLNNVKYTEIEYLNKIKTKTCENKIVEIDGVKYKLISIN